MAGCAGFAEKESSSWIKLSKKSGTRCEPVCKPDSVSWQARMAIIPLGRRLLSSSSDLPESEPLARCRARLRSGPLLPSYLVLLRVGFSLPRTSPSGRCALTLSPVARDRTFSPLPRRWPLGPARRYIFCGTVRTGRSSAVSRTRADPSWPLASTLPCGVRTFLPARKRSDRPTGSPQILV